MGYPPMVAIVKDQDIPIIQHRRVVRVSQFSRTPPPLDIAGAFVNDDDIVSVAKGG